jgi:superfamily II DNA/RNA helicase
VRLSGFDAPSPVTTFQQCGFDGALMGAIRKAGFMAPTPIQAQALPAVLSGRDVLVRTSRSADRADPALTPKYV